MKVHVPTQLRSYTGGAPMVNAQGPSLAAVMRDLDRRFPGMRFRIIDEQDQVRTHIRVFVNGAQAMDLETRLAPQDEVRIVGALSGG